MDFRQLYKELDGSRFRDTEWCIGRSRVEIQWPNESGPELEARF